ncbi:hypothetical protein ES703_08500 [subsurface metagenome]
MAGHLKYDPRFTRELIIEYLTSSRVVTEKPCYLFSSLVSPHTFSQDCQARLRNGETVNADILLNLKSQWVQPTHDYLFPVYFNRGLYVELVGEILSLLDDCGDTSNIEAWGELKDGLNPVDETTLVKEGSHSMRLGVDADLDVANYATWDNYRSLGDLSAYQHDWLYLWVYFSTLDYVEPVTDAALVIIGTVYGDSVYRTWARSELTVGWNLLKFDFDNPSGVLGTIDWTNIRFMRILTYEVAGSTTDFTIYVDSIMLVRPFSGATDGITEGVTVQYLIE